MQLRLQNFAGLVGIASAAVQGGAARLVDLTVGSTLRAVLEASASLGLWLQWLIVQVLQTTRAGTSEGADLDSWMADFGVTRLPAVSAVGVLAFGRFTTGGMVIVPVGVQARTGDGSLVFRVQADQAHASWRADLQGYVVAVGGSVISVPAIASVSGSSGNVQAGAVSLISSALPGIDTVTNAQPFLGGLDGESDDALRARFTRFLDSRSRATPAAIAFAIDGVQQGMQHSLQEYAAPGGVFTPGSFIVTVDDGTGSPSSALMSAAAAAIEAVRPIGAIYTVKAPTIVVANVALVVRVAPGAVGGMVRDRVANAIASYINTLGLGAPLVWSRLIQVAYDETASVIGVGDVLANGAATDLDPGTGGVVKAGTVVVS